MQVALHLLPPFSPVTIVQTIDFSVCNASQSNALASHINYNTIPQVVLAVALLIIAVIPIMKGTVEMYKATNHWQPNCNNL
jgi:Na+/alanine symporter